MTAIPNPPNAPAGHVAEWNGTAWEIGPIRKNIVPTRPIIPEGYSAHWNELEWVVSPPPPPPEPPTPSEITTRTMLKASYALNEHAFYFAQGVWDNIVPDSQFALKQWSQTVTSIMAKAQKILVDGTDEAYAEELPPAPSVNPASKDGHGFTVYLSEPSK